MLGAKRRKGEKAKANRIKKLSSCSVRKLHVVVLPPHPNPLPPKRGARELLYRFLYEMKQTMESMQGRCAHRPYVI